MNRVFQLQVKLSRHPNPLLKGDLVTNVYRKPKTYRKPPRPPQKPTRSNERLTISPPRLMTEQSSDGWRTATLTVPESAPVPPPRKKRKRNTMAYSMDDLSTSRPELTLTVSTLSLPDHQGAIRQMDGLESKSASTTVVVTPVIESPSVQEELDTVEEEKRENLKITDQDKIENDDVDSGDVADIIIPIEKETLFSSRTLLHSNLGYIDKLSAISEVSTESGFDDRVDFCKNSERSESAASSVETGAVDPGHERTARQVAELNELNREIREKTAISKTAWLQSILKVDAEPYSIPRERRGSVGCQPDSSPSRLHLVNREAESFAVVPSSPTPPPSPTNHSVLLEFLQKQSDEPESHFVPREESIFLTNTRTNIIYKSLSKDKLTDDYDSDFTIGEESSKDDFKKSGPISESDDAPEPTNRVNDSTLTTPLTDYAFQSPQLVESVAGLNSLLSDDRSNVVSSFDQKPIKSQHYVTALKTLQVSQVPVIVLNGVTHDSPETTKDDKTYVEDKDKELENRESAPSSRKSSITDSLHEFEMSIYDMLKESKKDSSDEEESLKTVKLEAKKQ